MINNLNLNEKYVVDSYDELPLWSAPFGLKLLEKIDLKESLNVLDLGCGTGFPCLEVSQRLGFASKVFGIDLWLQALKRAKLKAGVYKLKNAKFLSGNGLCMPFKNNIFDLIISNNGINNTGDEKKAIKECFRVCKKDGFLIFTANLPETMSEFYSIFKKVLIENNLKNLVEKVDIHIKKHRKSIEEYKNFILNANFKIEDIEEDKFYMRFLNGSKMLNYHFIKLCFLKPWFEIIKEYSPEIIFNKLLEELNKFSKMKDGLSLTIPFVCFKCKK